MTAWQSWTETIAKKLSGALGVAIAPSELVIPPDPSLGDFAFGCFRISKERNKKPNEIAQEIAQTFDAEHLGLASMTAVGPYVNFTLDAGEAVHRVIQEVEEAGEAYGGNDDGIGKEILFEYAQPNTHKEIHIGHLRNLVLGNALVNLLRETGARVIPVSYHGDVGAHVAKCLWELGDRTVDEKDHTGKFLGEMYAKATARLDEHPELKDEVSLVQQKLEAHDPAWEKLWKETRQWSLSEMARVFDELGTKIERQYLESEVADRGQEMVDDLIARRIAKESQGAIIVDLEDVKLGVFLVRKSDGTTLYATKDLALAERKAKEYPRANPSFMLVDTRQSFYFKQLFEVFHRMGMKQTFAFIGYEFVTLKAGAMSSRKGNVVTYEDSRDAIVTFAMKEVEARHADWPQKKKEEVARMIAMGGIKFGMLKQDNDKILVFDPEQALSFDGATGPYCQYAVTRLTSILKKAGVGAQFIAPSGGIGEGVMNHAPTSAFDHPSEKNLVMTLARFPDTVARAAKTLRPLIIAEWCLEAARRINDFYRDVPVLESEENQRAGRLRLVSAARHVLARGLALLGIPVPEEM